MGNNYLFHLSVISITIRQGMRVPRPEAGDRGVGTIGGETQRNALLLCLLFLTPSRERKLVKSTEPKRADLIFKLHSSDYRRSQQLLAAVSGRYLTKLYSHPRSVPPLPTLHTCAETRSFGVATAACENPEERGGASPKQLFW